MYFVPLQKRGAKNCKKSAGLQIIRKYDMQPGFFAEIDRKRRLENVTASSFENLGKANETAPHHRLSAEPPPEGKPRSG